MLVEAGPGPARVGIKGARYRSHEPAVERQEMLLGEEYVHYWPGTTGWAASLHAPTGMWRGKSDGHGWAGLKE